jgi:hypothetical protein
MVYEGPSSVRLIGWGKKLNVPSDYNPDIGVKPRKSHSNKVSESIITPIESESESPRLPSIEMADKEPEPWPGITPMQPEDLIADTIAHPSMQSPMRLNKSESHPLTEMQVMMTAFAQLAKDLTNNRQQILVSAAT